MLQIGGCALPSPQIVQTRDRGACETLLQGGSCESGCKPRGCNRAPDSLVPTGQPRSHRASSPAFALGIARDEERGDVPCSFPLRNRVPSGQLGHRPLALASLWAVRSGDVTEAALVAARNLPGRLEAGDYTQKILKSLDELLVHGFGRDVNLRAVVDDAAGGACSCIGRKG